MPHIHGSRRLQRNCAAVVMLAALAAGCGSTNATEARLVAGASVATDFSTLADATFEAFLDAAPGVAACIGEVRLEAATSLPDAAHYTPTTRTVTVRVPATAPNLSDSLVHELAHHLEAACRSHLDLRDAFLQAQGLDPGSPWFDGASWEQTPSEQFAEAVVLVVLERRRRNVGGVAITPEARAVVADWLAG
ncbi:MAG TPA: hypothetical protein VLG28_00720 [Acidimicrobiia bacterium]|jgi:hypothetical protein|nr:hypothetical protein [Acidimicrobiia bacterium]